MTNPIGAFVVDQQNSRSLFVADQVCFVFHLINLKDSIFQYDAGILKTGETLDMTSYVRNSHWGAPLCGSISSSNIQFWGLFTQNQDIYNPGWSYYVVRVGPNMETADSITLTTGGYYGPVWAMEVSFFPI
jgi:hypothetical protein